MQMLETIKQDIYVTVLQNLKNWNLVQERSNLCIFPTVWNDIVKYLTLQIV